MSKLLTRKRILLVSAILALLGGAAWWQGGPLLARYCVYKLDKAGEASREKWLARVVGLGEAAVPSLLASLAHADQEVCDNNVRALVGLAGAWGPDDARSQALVEKVTAQFESLNELGQSGVLQVAIFLLQKQPQTQNVPPALTRLAGDLLSAALKVEAVRDAALHLAGALLERMPQQWLAECRRLALEGMGAAAATTRVAAIQLALRPPLRHDSAVLVKCVPLLKDSAAPVRKAALLALGPVRELVSDDDLLPLLHDPDDGVQNLCELTLRSRGLPDNHILLARLISDQRPSARLQVLQHLHAADLEPGVWLRRLCQDPAAAVRAAAVRAAVSQSQVDLRDCLSDIARQDPSLTVRQLAEYYLTRYRPVTAN
jgi:hypothetical protein